MRKKKVSRVRKHHSKHDPDFLLFTSSFLLLSLLLLGLGMIYVMNGNSFSSEISPVEMKVEKK